MIILALDQAPKNIGYAYGAIGGVPTRGVRRNPEYGEATILLGESVYDWTVNLIKSSGAERVYFEQVLVRKFGLHMPTLYNQFMVANAVQFAALDCGLKHDVYDVDIADWRREFYRGSRPVKSKEPETEQWKEMALKECLDRGWLVDDHNTAEACGIWWFGCLHTDRRSYNAHKVEARRSELKRWNAEAL